MGAGSGSKGGFSVEPILKLGRVRNLSVCGFAAHTQIAVIR
jgi:hypothetical protein